MARTREFDPTDALDRAMHAFWSNGFEGASFERLVDETRVSRHGLYQEFGDKRSLLSLALTHYERTILKDLTADLGSDGASLAAIETFFERVARVARSESGGSGCFMCNSQVELSSDPRIRKQTDAFFRRLHRLFRLALDRAWVEGELHVSADTNSLSHYLIGLVRGISANARSGSSQSQYRAYVETSLGVLR